MSATEPDIDQGLSTPETSSLSPKSMSGTAETLNGNTATEIESVGVDARDLDGKDARKESARNDPDTVAAPKPVFTSGRKTPVVIKQHLSRIRKLAPPAGNSPDPSLGGAIQWEARVYDTEPLPLSHGVIARYLDDRPINPAVNTSADDEYEATDGLETSEHDQSEWSGPVFVLRHQAYTAMPYVRHEYRRHCGAYTREHFDCQECEKFRAEELETDASVSEQESVLTKPEYGIIRNVYALPETLDGLRIQYWSQPTLVIKSPHLAQEVAELIKHYPERFEHLIHDSKDFEIEIDYPYGALLHHYLDIKSRLNDFATAADEAVPGSDHFAETASLSSIESFRADPRLAKPHLEVLAKYLEPLYESLLLPCQRARSESRLSVSFDMLWHVLRPGTMVYVTDAWTPWFVAIIHTIDRRLDKDATSAPWIIELWMLSCDGVRMGRHSVHKTIDWFAGNIDLTSLDICPTDVWDEARSTARREQALNRGRLMEKAFRQGFLLANYSDLNAANQSGHTGKVVIDHRRGMDMTGLKLNSFNINSAADYPSRDKFESYDDIILNEPWIWSPEDSLWRDAFRTIYVNDNDDLDDEHPNKVITSSEFTPLTGYRYRYHGYQPRYPSFEGAISDDLSEDQLMLIYPLTFGFALESKKWLELDASHLQAVVPSPDCLDNLVLDESSGKQEKQVIQALAARVRRTDTWSADHIKGKGAGGIILLHGPPGTGKTYTVELVAELLERPLLALSVADVGTVETAIERELIKWFTLAELWNAVLLIDEADIFLERRQTKDLARNGLVTAFLRRAEYFRGLLFLTTNRVGHIDDAFISRVHVAIRYSNLDGPELAKIWKGFFKKLEHDKDGKIRVLGEAEDWVLTEFEQGRYNGLNGRDIRNALQTAITLAEYEHEKQMQRRPDSKRAREVIVSKAHFERVLEMSYRFRAYVDSIRKADEKARASQRGERNDFADGDTSPSITEVINARIGKRRI